MHQAEIGIIGGSGLPDAGFNDAQEVRLQLPSAILPMRTTYGLWRPQVDFLHATPWPQASAERTEFPGQYSCFKQLGVEPLSRFRRGLAKRRTQAARFLIPNQLFDRTRHRIEPSLATALWPRRIATRVRRNGQGGLGACKVADVPRSSVETYVCMEGPQFSTKAESNIYRSWGAM